MEFTVKIQVSENQIHESVISFRYAVTCNLFTRVRAFHIKVANGVVG